MRRHQRLLGQAAAEWQATFILGKNEPGYETDTRKLKVGVGSTEWSSLPYFSVGLSTNIMAALEGASSPSSTNVFATMDDLASTNITELVPVISQTNTPAVGPTTGDRYLINTAPTGVWVGHGNKIAEWDGAAWAYTVPVANNTVYITASLTTKRYNGTAWVAYTGTALLQNGNTLGAPVSIGTRDNQVVYFKTNNANRVRVNNAGLNVAGSLYVGSLTATPTANFHVAGTVRLVTGNQGANKVLVSDASGNADWQTLSSGWALDGNTVVAEKWLGTIDNFALPFRTNNIERIKIYTDGRISIGTGATIANADEISIGGSSASSGGQAIAVGYSSISVGGGVAVGYGAQSLVNRGVAIGFTAIASSQGVSIGYTATTNDRGVAIGYGASCTGSAISIGESSTAVGGVSLRGSGTGPASFAVIGAHTGGGSGIAILGVAESDDNIAIGFRAKATAAGSIIFGRSIDNATYLTNSVANSVGFGWTEATPTVLFAKTATQYINGTGGLVIGATTVHASAALEVTSTTKAFRLTPMTAAQASAITVAEGLLLCVSDTDATFTSIGFWGYENGAWAKM